MVSPDQIRDSHGADETRRDSGMEAVAPKTNRDDDQPSRSDLPDELSRMIREANAEGGLPFQRMADRAAEAGVSLSKSYFQKLSINAVPTPPTPDRLHAIAAALRQPLNVIQRAAAAQWLDYRSTELSGYDDDVRVIVAHLAGMKKGELKRWRAMIEAVEQADRGDD